jgi:hypothetical protein
MKIDAPSAPASTRRPSRSAATSSYRAAQSPPPSSTPAPPQPEVTTGIASDQRAAQSPPPLSTPTRPQPVVPTGIPSNHRTAQFPPHSPQSIVTSSLPDLAPAPNPLVKLTPPNQHNLTPLDINQERHSQATIETLNISVTLDVSCPSTPTIAVTATSGISNSYKTHTESNKTVTGHADPPGPKLEGLTSKAPKLDATPPPLPPQNKKSVQRPVWKVWFQNIWNGGK